MKKIFEEIFGLLYYKIGVEDKMEIDKSEVLRYLGYKNQHIDEKLTELIDECIGEVIDISERKYIYNIFDIKEENEGILLLNTVLYLKGKDIYKHLNSSEGCALMAVTLGLEMDKRIAFYSKFNITKAVIMDACASTAVEALCDIVQCEIGEAAAKSGLYITKRFSPGYGDFSVEHQRGILNVLDCERKIGLTLTDSFLMLPRKSVTAVIGLGRSSNIKSCEKCMVCNMKNCIYRKVGKSCEE